MRSEVPNRHQLCVQSEQIDQWSHANAGTDTLDLSAAVDVYSDWIDACDAVAKEAAGKDDATQSYADYPSGGDRRRDSELDDRHMVEIGEDGDDYNEQGDYDDE